MGEGTTRTIEVGRGGRNPSPLRRLSLVYQDERARRPPVTLALEQGELVLGREAGAGRISIDDPGISREHARISLVRDLDVLRIRDLGSKNGTFVNGVRTDADHLRPGSVIRVGGALLVYAELRPSFAAEDDSLSPEAGSLAMALTWQRADLVAPTPLSVLITGDTGVGKELIAQRIHRESGRTGPFVAVNCAALPRELFGSELFGHARGAFSGAIEERAGLIASAEGGTLFLDEIADLPIDQQPALLRVLEDHSVRPVGSDVERKVDVRVIAATNRDLGVLEREGRFRGDLLARLEAFALRVPSLTERREEILSLFWTLAGPTLETIAIDAAEALLLYGWPKNVRELQRVAASAKLLTQRSRRVELVLLPSAIQACVPRAPSGEDGGEPPGRDALDALLRQHRGNVSRVAEGLGETRQRLYRWLEAYGLDAASYRSDQR